MYNLHTPIPGLNSILVLYTARNKNERKKNLGANNIIELELDSWQAKKKKDKYISYAF